MKNLAKLSALLFMCVIWGSPPCLAQAEHKKADAGQEEKLAPLERIIGPRAEEKKADAGQENKLAPLERFIGEWVIHGHSNGAAFNARTVYDWGIGKKFITVKAFVKDGDKEYQGYEGVLGWHPKKKSLFQISFAFNGEITEYILQSKDQDTIQINEGQPGKIRQTLRFKDKDHFIWTALLKTDGEWKGIVEGTGERKKK